MFLAEVKEFYESPKTESCLSFFRYHKLNLAIMRFVPPLGKQFFLSHLYPKLDQAKTRTLGNLTESEMRLFARTNKKLGMGNIGLGALGLDQIDFAMPLDTIEKVAYFFEAQEQAFEELSYVPEVDWHSYKFLYFDEVVDRLSLSKTGRPMDDLENLFIELKSMSGIRRLLHGNLFPMLNDFIERMCWPDFRCLHRCGWSGHDLRLRRQDEVKRPSQRTNPKQSRCPVGGRPLLHHHRSARTGEERDLADRLVTAIYARGTPARFLRSSA